MRHALIVTVMGLLLALLQLPPAYAAEARLHVVALDGPGTAGGRSAAAIAQAQDDVLARAGIDEEPVYSWHTALAGFAVPLTPAQAEELADDPLVARVEPARLHRLASAPVPTGQVTSAARGRPRGGAGTVIGVVDSGLDPEAPGFATVPGLGPEPTGFRGACQPGEGWPASTCDGKIIGARWFVEGFGRDKVAAGARLSAYDDAGHGTASASIAAGGASVDVRVPGIGTGTHSGQAPQARIAAYKACWTAPDPDDDGCSTADLVADVDAATADGVDVLNLSVAGAGTDLVDLALLGAAEAGVFVSAAGGAGRFAAHESPWVTTVGGTAGAQPLGRLTTGRLRLTGVMAARRRVPAAPVVTGARAAAAGSSRADARVCRPGSLDAALVSGRIVVCERGVVSRVDKSAAVHEADGVAMVLLNHGGPLEADFHAVPTLHLARPAGHRLLGYLARHPRARAALAPAGERRPDRVALTSASGRPGAPVVKPDVAAPAAGVLAAVPGTGRERWELATGTSAAAALTSGVAAVLLQRTGWSAARVRSALVTTATPVRGPVLRTGGGAPHLQRAERPGLVFDVDPAAYPPWLTGRTSRQLNLPSLQLDTDGDTAVRTVTNTTHRARYFSARAVGFRHHTVRVRPLALLVEPGESARFTVTASGESPRFDDGWVVWRGATGTTTRVPVVISR